MLATYADAPDASWGVRARSTGLVYLVEEGSRGAIGVHRPGEPAWRKQDRVPSGGADPCYLSLDPAERRLVAANYASGSIAVFALDDLGSPVLPPRLFNHTGRGPVPDRQERPHAHCALFGPDGHLYHVDLGTDQILRHGIGAADEPRPDVVFRAPAGSGPRHLLYHPSLPIALLVSELVSTLTLLDVAAPEFVVRQRLSTLPEGFSGESLGGHLAIDATGSRVYVSNRGHDSLAVFALDAGSGCTLLQHISSQGASPRHFALLEHHGLLALANEESGNLVLFGIEANGCLISTGQSLDIPGAAFVLADQETPAIHPSRFSRPRSANSLSRRTGT